MLRFEPRPTSHGSMHAAAPATTTPEPIVAKQADHFDMSATMAPHHRHLWIVTGPAGCGKSTVANNLADQFGYPYIEGDEFHPQNNIDKMAAGVPLTDEDRWDWLTLLRKESTLQLGKNTAGVVLTCSALKVKYRNELRKASYNDQAVLVHFIYLEATEELLLARVKARQGHYMKDGMVKSQFTALEAPAADEKDVFRVDVSGSMAEVQQLAIDVVTRVLAQDEQSDDSASDDSVNVVMGRLPDASSSRSPAHDGGSSTGSPYQAASTPASSVQWDESEQPLHECLS